MKLLIILMTLTGSATAFSEPYLSQATNEQLLREVGKRLGTNLGGGGTGRFAFSVGCSGSSMQVKLYDRNFSEVEDLSFNLIYGETCLKALDKLVRFQNSGVNVGQILIMCNRTNLTKYGIKPNGELKVIDSENLYHANSCVEDM